MRNRLFQEFHARDCQEMKELRRICCEELDRARQARIDELSLHQEKKPTTVSDDSSSGITEKSKFFVRRQRFFYDLEAGSSSGSTHVPGQTPTMMSPRTMLRCDSGLPRDTQNDTGITRNVFERPLAQERQSCTIFNISKIGTSSQGTRPDTTETAKEIL